MDPGRSKSRFNSGGQPLEGPASTESLATLAKLTVPRLKLAEKGGQHIKLVLSRTKALSAQACLLAVPDQGRSKINAAPLASAESHKHSSASAMKAQLSVQKHRTPGRLAGNHHVHDSGTAASRPTSASEMPETSHRSSKSSASVKQPEQPVKLQPSGVTDRAAGQTNGKVATQPPVTTAQKAAAWIQQDAAWAKKAARRPAASSSQLQSGESPHARTPSAGAPANAYDAHKSIGEIDTVSVDTAGSLAGH